MMMMLKLFCGLVVVLLIAVFVARKIRSRVYVERTFNASAEKVWQLWNNPEVMKKWWGPKNYTAPVIKNDFRVGGRYLLSMQSPKGEIFWNTGTYKEIAPNKRIVASLSFSDESGRVVPGAEVRLPGQWPDEIMITVEFTELEGKTNVSVTEEGIPLIMKLFASLGWKQQFDKFEGLL